MNCEPTNSLWIAYMDGRATAAECREVEAHLAACSTCRTRAEEFRRLWSVLDEAPALEPSPSFDAHLRARIGREPRPSSRWAWLIPSPRLALVVSLLLLAAWVASLPPATSQSPMAPLSSEAEFKMIKDLPVLEDYDVLSNFEALNELPPNAGDSGMM